MLLKSKVAVVTGSNRGIGKKILDIFSKNGADVIACVRNPDDKFRDFVKGVAKETNNKIHIIKLDFQKEDSVKEALKQISLLDRKIDILVNNAGIIYTGIFQMTPIAKLREIFEINFFSQSIFVQGLIKKMVKNKTGSIIYISSSSAIDANEGRSAYSASKAALITHAKTLSKELGVFNIRVNSIAPGLTLTDMMKDNTSESIVDEVTKTISLRRVGQPDEIAKAALFLGSDLSTYVSGQTIRVDGGMN